LNNPVAVLQGSPSALSRWTTRGGAGGMEPAATVLHASTTARSSASSHPRPRRSSVFAVELDVDIGKQRRKVVSALSWYSVRKRVIARNASAPRGGSSARRTCRASSRVGQAAPAATASDDAGSQPCADRHLSRQGSDRPSRTGESSTASPSDSAGPCSVRAVAHCFGTRICARAPLLKRSSSTTSRLRCSPSSANGLWPAPIAIGTVVQLVSSIRPRRVSDLAKSGPP